MPTRPSNSPNQPIGLIASPNTARANSATNRGWESINTDPRPAPVWPRPWASRAWNRAPSTRANSTNAARSAGSTRSDRPSRRAASSSTSPAGSKRRLASSRGSAPASSGFIAAIAVPQRAKGNSISGQRSRGERGAAGLAWTMERGEGRSTTGGPKAALFLRFAHPSPNPCPGPGAERPAAPWRGS